MCFGQRRTLQCWGRTPRSRWGLCRTRCFPDFLRRRRWGRWPPPSRDCSAASACWASSATSLNACRSTRTDSEPNFLSTQSTNPTLLASHFLSKPTGRSAQTHPLLTLRRCRSSLWRRRRPDCPAGSAVRVWSTSCPSPHYSSPSVWWGRAESRPGYKPHCPRTQTRRPGASQTGSECPSNCNPETHKHRISTFKNHFMQT